MQINIQIIAVSKTHVPNAKGGYDVAEVTYKDLQSGKVQAKKLMSFLNQPMYNTLANATAGQVYQIEMAKEPAKDGKEYWNFKSATLGQGEGVGAAPASTAAAAKSAPVVKSTYETPEERAKRQVLIVRQSALAQSIALLTTGAKQPPSRDLVLGEAQAFVDWVFENDAIVTNTGFDQMESDEIV